jgi:tetratricopeptide (TPR) repeat protein
MHTKQVSWVVPVFLIFVLEGPALQAQQTAPGSPDAAAPAQTNFIPRPAPTARDMAVDHAKAEMAEKRYEESIRDYQELLKSEPKNAVFMNMIGIAYLNLGNFSQARKFFERAVKADKTYPSAVNNLGMVWYQQKNYRRAIREYQRAVAIDADQPGTHANLGYAYYKTKKYAEAAGEFRKALELDPHAFDHNDRGGTMMQDRTVENHGLFFFMMAKEYAQVGDAPHCADYLRKSLDEGYKDIAKAKTDPAFKKVLNDPTVQGVLVRIGPGDSKPATASPGA